MKLRLKILLLAILPFLVAMAAISAFTLHQGLALADKEKEAIRQAWMQGRISELRHYVRIAQSAIAPLVAATGQDGADTDALQRQALALLHRLDFGPDGYFYVYDQQGVNLMHPRQPELVGRSLWELRDPRGEPTLQRLLAAARRSGAQGEALPYYWEKPSARQTTEKLGYVVEVAPWGWMMGTGLYLDDIDATLARIDETALNNIHTTQIRIAGIALLGVALVMLCGLALNISDQRQSDAKLQRMARQVVHSQEEERARLARELHDGISQLLVSVKLMLESARHALGRHASICQAPRGNLDDTLQQAQERLNTTLAEVRRISHNLRPTLLDDLGLDAALRHLVQELPDADATAEGLPICAEFSSHGTARPLPDTHATTLFRIAQEALVNVLRHARAHSVRVILSYNTSDISLYIADDGQGFDLESVHSDPMRGLGLRSMRERLETLGGSLYISAGGHGTTVLAKIPLPEARAAASTTRALS